VKRVRPGLQVGFHLEHVNSFSPIFRTTRSHANLAAKADFLRVVVYNNCGGERYANFIRNVGSTVFRDVLWWSSDSLFPYWVAASALCSTHMDHVKSVDQHTMP